ncbi:MAG: hypothetical protein GC155_03605 [Alphaproteobacteria bacterium]|nr:hypothetical protein [Alphaproteobacteria bacterium]
MSRSAFAVPAGLLAFAALGAVTLVRPAHAETRSYAYTNFDEVDASAGVNVVLKQGPFSISVDGDKQEVARIVVEQHGSKLTVTHTHSVSWFGIGHHSVVTVTAPTYNAISAHGGADIDTADLSLGDVSLAASGGADIRALNLKVQALTVAASGGADIKATGSCTDLTATASSGADYKGSDMKCQTADVRASGGADADAWASVSATGKASGGADVRIRGNPAKTDKTESGGGDVKIL